MLPSPAAGGLPRLGGLGVQGLGCEKPYTGLGFGLREAHISFMPVGGPGLSKALNEGACLNSTTVPKGILE